MTNSDYDDQFDDVLQATDGLATCTGETGQKFEAWRGSLRAELRDMLRFPVARDSVVEGTDPRRREYPKATVRYRGYERWTQSIHTERRLRTPFYLPFPDSVGPPYPVIVALHGHTEHGRGLVADAAGGRAAGRHIADDR